MVVKIIAEGVLLGILLVLFCAFGIRNGAVNMVFLYHQNVQERCVKNDLIPQERIKHNAKIFKSIGIPVYFVFILQFMPGGARPSLQSAVQFRHKR